MPSRQDLLALVRSGRSYEEIGVSEHIAPGLAYLIATGLPADGSDVLPAEALRNREGLLPSSTQHLANPPTEAPTRDAATEEWMRNRARADGPMQQAAARRTAEPEPPVAEEETDDVLSVLGWQHNQVKALQQELEAIPDLSSGNTPDQRQRRESILDMMRVRLSQHETAEEAHFWPAVREALDDGDALADAALAQEQQGKDLFQELMGLSAGEARFDELVVQLIAVLRKHVAFEDSVFLRLREAMPVEEREKVGRKIERAERVGPTRPHPHAPDTPPANRVAAAAAGPLDRARDALGSRPAKRRGRTDDVETPPESDTVASDADAGANGREEDHDGDT